MRARCGWALAVVLAAGGVGRADEAERAARALEALTAGRQHDRVVRDRTAPGRPVVEVRLLNDLATDEQLKLVGRLPGLRRLALVNARVTDAGLKELAGLARLEELDVHTAHTKEELSDAGLEALLPLKGLKVLTLNSHRVTSAGMATVARLPAVESLDLTSTNVGDEGLKALTGLRSLRRLNVTNTPVTDAGVAHLARMGELTDLELNDTRITDDALAAVKKLTKLRRLSLASTDVSDAGVKHLAGMTSLRDLYLTVHNSSKQLTDACIPDLLALKNLETLWLSTSAMTAKRLARLAELTRLKQVRLIAHALVRDPQTGARNAQIGQTAKELRELEKLFPPECVFMAERGSYGSDDDK